MVNHRTYLRGLTSKGTIACTKRPPERAEVEIRGIYTGILMDRLTNPNSKVGSEIPRLYNSRNYKNVQGVRHYIVCFSLSQSTQPTSSSSKNDGDPKSITSICRERTEFGISRHTKVLGKRRVHSTAFICRKGSNKFSVGDVEFEGSTIKNQFNLLFENLKLNKKVNNLTTILSNKHFLIGCYLNIKSKPGNMTSSLDNETLDGINMK
jgi:hypothetical protein